MKVELPLRQRGNCCEVSLELEPAAVEAAVDLLRLLADPARLQMMAALQQADQPVCVCDFTAALGLSQPTISHHMGKLKGAGLVKVTREGVWSFYEIAPQLTPAQRDLLRSTLAVGQAAVGSQRSPRAGALPAGSE
jgi:ArsR family transcriptional regulator, arsenate/arsenite/antimonite-responsive transcriptional repressor